jgi:hypothetical protein
MGRHIAWPIGTVRVGQRGLRAPLLVGGVNDAVTGSAAPIRPDQQILSMFPLGLQFSALRATAAYSMEIASKTGNNDSKVSSDSP